MRARLAVQSAGITVEQREILLRDKPQAFLDCSPSATVPALQLPDRVIDESLDIMLWALDINDPQRLLDVSADAWCLIEACDGPFKTALDRTKYASRFPDNDPLAERARAAGFLKELDARLAGQGALCGPRHTIADVAILPFIRQFANIDRHWFNAQPWPDLAKWLEDFTQGTAFSAIMHKYPPWKETAAQI